jgi:amino acid adenylation domain-containing protein/FkbM family methyltransferase
VTEGDRGRLSIPIGKPISNVQLYVLDGGLRPVPVGVAGELWIGGVGLARGYVNDPERTAGQFVWHAALQQRLYRTGDVAKRLADGNLEYMGRMDTQVKLRGYRIELGEIAAVIKGHAGVGDAYILPQFRDGHIESLTGFFTPHPHHAGMVAKVLEGQGGAEAQADLLYLPNGLPLFYKNKAETAAIYKEIFEEHLYHRHLDSLCAGDVVLDVGANIGLFSLYIGLHHPGVRVYAFEPIAAIHDTLGKNISLYGLGTVALNIGLGESEQEVAFTYYPHNTALSGRYGDDAKDKALARAAMLHQPESAALGEEALESLLDERIRPERVVCRVRRLSSVLRDQGIGEIALLKVDAERSEWEVLQGLDEWDWQRIRQLVLEVHDEGGRLDEIRRMLELRGYALHLEQQEELGSSGLYTVYARRQQEPLASDGGGTYPTLPAYNMGTLWTSPQALAESVRGWCQSSLPAYMVPSSLHLIEGLPVTSHGKIDKDALQELGAGLEKARRKYRGAENSLQQRLVLIWEEILHKGPVGIGDNFFELGGHSLKATQAVSRIHKQLGVKIELGSIFSYPTIEKLAQIIKETNHGKIAEVIPVVPEQESYRLSHAQRRLWILDKFEENKTAYIIPVTLVLEGTLQVEMLRKALTYLVDRYEILRTTIAENGNAEPMQYIHDKHQFNLPFEVIDGCDEADQDLKMRALAEQEATMPFSLEQGPLFRIRLLSLSDTRYVLYITFHHIVIDGWSIEVLTRKLITVYNTFVQNEEISLEPLIIQYKEYAQWQFNQIYSDPLKKHQKYWLSQFEGEVPVLELPTKKRPEVKTYHGSAVTIQLPEESVIRIKELSQRNDASVFITLLASVNALLHRYTQQDDIVVGTTIAGRDHWELENQIGFFINTLALRNKVERGDTFLQLLQKVRHNTLQAYEHQYYPFDKLVDDLQLTRDVSRTPLFDVLVEWINLDIQEGVPNEMKDVKIRPCQLSKYAIAKFDLSFRFTYQDNGGIQLNLEYNSDLFDSDRIEYMGKHFIQLLDNLLQTPEKSINSHQMLSLSELKRITEEYNNTEAVYPADETIVSLFETQVAQTPHALAFQFEDVRLNYQELNELSNRLANYLRTTFSIHPNDRIALKMERSERMMIALLGILKAGAAYVPIDPTYPQERIEYMLSDANVKCLLLNDPSDSTLSVPIVTEKDWEAIEQHPSSNPQSVICPQNLAYVLYTSGTTGTPKGVLLEHRGIVNRLAWQWQAYGFTNEDVIFQKTPYVFDVSAWELFMPLCFGGSLVMCRAEVASDPVLLMDCIERYRITTTHFVPGMLQVFLQSLEVEDKQKLISLKRIIASGEALLPETVRLHHAKIGIPLYNLYGPTEASIDVSHYTTNIEDIVVPIGKPIWNTRLYILDPSLQPVAEGLWGQIAIGGTGLAQGYLNKPELTQQKFVEITVEKGIIQRVYLTGDIGRWFHRGNIEYKGRQDTQVKLRGQRIELGEIENTLLKHNLIKSVAVALKKDASGDSFIVAYIVAIMVGNDKQQLQEQLIKLVSQFLPAYMMPSSFEFLDQLPVSINGKINYKALPEPVNMIVGEEYMAPSNEMEKHLISLLEEVMGRKPIGVRDHFFQIGGNSLKAARFFKRINTQFPGLVKMSDLFVFDTVEALSQHILSQTEPVEEVVEKETVPFRRISI